MPPTKVSKLEDIPPTQINTPPPPPPPTVTPTAPLIPAPIAKTDQQLTRPTETPPSPSSTVSFIHSPQINIPILEKIPPPAEKSTQADITSNRQTQVMTKTIITTVTKPDGTTSTTTETFLYPAIMKDASVQTIELYEPCDYMTTKQQEKKEGKKTGQKERKKESQKKRKRRTTKRNHRRRKKRRKQPVNQRKKRRRKKRKQRCKKRRHLLSRVEAVLKKTKSVRPISPLLSSSSSDSDSV